MLPNIKLTDEDVIRVRQLYVPRRFTAKMLAEKFGVTTKYIEGILTGKRRPPLDGDIGRMTIATTTFDKIKNLIPRNRPFGRFALVRQEIMDLVQAKPEAAVLRPQKKSMDKKEVTAMLNAMKGTLEKKSPYTVKYNHRQAVFLFVKRSDLDKMKGE